jgi:hypothetical protein
MGKPQEQYLDPLLLHLMRTAKTMISCEPVAGSNAPALPDVWNI